MMSSLRRATVPALIASALFGSALVACNDSDDTTTTPGAGTVDGNDPGSSAGATGGSTAASGSTAGTTAPSTGTTAGATAGTTSGSTGEAPPAQTSKVRVVHASPDAPAVDVWAKGVPEPVIKGLAYGQTSAYLDLPAGTYEIELRAAPSKATDPVAYATGPLVIPAAAKITAVAAGLLAAKDDESKFRVLPLAEGFAPAAGGSANLRIVHASADAPTVGVDVGNDNPAAPELDGLARFAATAASGVALPAGKELQVGIAAGGKTVTAFTTPSLPAGADIFVIATGLLGDVRSDKAFSLLAVGPEGTIGFLRPNPVVYALHASPDAPAVDLFAGTAELVDDVAFGALSGALQVPPGAYTLDVFAHAGGSARPAGAPVKSLATGKLEPGKRYLAIATGFLTPKAGEQPFQLVAAVDEFEPTAEGQGRVRVLHASPDAPAVDVGVLASLNATSIAPVLIKGLAFGEATPGAGLGLAAATYNLGVTPAGANNDVRAKFQVPVTAKAQAFAIAAGSLARKDAQAFRLFVVNTAVSPWSLGTLSPR